MKASKDDRVDRIRHRLGDAGNDAAAIGMADQHEVPQLLVFDHAEHIGDVQGEVDAGPKQMRALAETGERRRKDGVSPGAQPVGDATPGPAAMPGAVHEKEGFGGHVRFHSMVLVSRSVSLPSLIRHVIPGRAEGANPESRTGPVQASGFRVRPFGPSRNDGPGCGCDNGIGTPACGKLIQALTLGVGITGTLSSPPA
jgi:hypothetical protein